MHNNEIQIQIEKIVNSVGNLYQSWLFDCSAKLLPKHIVEKIKLGDEEAIAKAGEFLKSNGFLIQPIMDDKRAGFHVRIVHAVANQNGAIESINTLSELHICLIVDKGSQKKVEDADLEGPIYNSNIIKL